MPMNLMTTLLFPQAKEGPYEGMHIAEVADHRTRTGEKAMQMYEGAKFGLEVLQQTQHPRKFALEAQWIHEYNVKLIKFMNKAELQAGVIKQKHMNKAGLSGMKKHKPVTVMKTHKPVTVM